MPVQFPRADSFYAPRPPGHFSQRKPRFAPGGGNIDPFGIPAFARPLKRRHYNDDDYMGQYKEARLRLSDRVRKGIREPLG